MSYSSNNPTVANQLPISLEIPEDPKQAQEILSLNMKKTAQVINTKTGGLYPLQEIMNFEQLFTAGNPQQFRTVYRQTFTFGAIAAGGGEIDIPVDLSSVTFFTRIYGIAHVNDPVVDIVDFRPIPYVEPGTTNNGITIVADTTNNTLRIVLGPGTISIISGIAILEYVKN